MAKPLVKTWEEAVGLVSDCRIIGQPLVTNEGTVLVMLLEDPTGQQFFFQITAKADMGLMGNIPVVKVQHQIVALEPEPGDVFRDKRW